MVTHNKRYEDLKNFFVVTESYLSRNTKTTNESTPILFEPKLALLHFFGETCLKFKPTTRAIAELLNRLLILTKNESTPILFEAK